jgi:DNA-binding NarL/FixJ family response regulator
MTPPKRMQRRTVAGTDRTPELTTRQLQVLNLLVEGYPAAAIAATMHVTRSTVEHHKQQLFRRLGARNQTHAVAIALEHDLLPLVDR